MLKPKDIDTRGHMGSSSWRNCETEIIARNIIMQQKKANPNAWTPFTWDTYVAFCTHSVTSSEQGVIEALVNGGAPVTGTTARFEPGYLKKNPDGSYMVTEKFIDALPDSVKRK